MGNKYPGLFWAITNQAVSFAHLLTLKSPFMKMTVRKKLALLVLAAFTLGTASAQVQFGVKAGANVASWSGSAAGGLSSQVGFNGGVMVNLPLEGMLSLSPELLYSGQGAKGTSSGTVVSGHVNYFNVPVLFKYTSSMGLYGETGPQLGFLLSANLKSGGTTTNDKADFKSTDFSWAFGVGYLTTASIGIDARYNLGLSNIVAASGGGTLKNNVFQIGLFYLFGETDKKH
jgi:hypothetical protein